MRAAIVLLMLAPAAATAESPAALRCLPGEDGFLTMRLRGSIEEDVNWREPGLSCTGMSRPDGKGLRVRFAGRLAGGELAVVFAAPGLGVGASGRAVPVNVTLLDGAAERIYGTQGETRCEFDEVEQSPLANAALPAKTFRIRARGFCVAPARAVDGEGSVLLTRFDFAGLVSDAADDAPPTAATATGR